MLWNKHRIQQTSSGNLTREEVLLLSKYTWVYFLLFLLALILVLLFFRVPILPFTEPPEENVLTTPPTIDSLLERR